MRIVNPFLPLTSKRQFIFQFENSVTFFVFRWCNCQSDLYTYKILTVKMESIDIDLPAIRIQTVKERRVSKCLSCSSSDSHTFLLPLWYYLLQFSHHDTECLLSNVFKLILGCKTKRDRTACNMQSRWGLHRMQCIYALASRIRMHPTCNDDELGVALDHLLPSIKHDPSKSKHLPSETSCCR